MRLGWNEIKQRAIRFSQEWSAETREEAEVEINIRAAEVMGRLHDAMAAGGYGGHALERFLVRVLFCLFAEDTGIFDPNAFTEYLADQTRPDGSDLGMNLGRIFQVLDTPQADRQTNLDERLLGLPYVNGGLFAEPLPLAEMDAAMRAALMRCTEFDWSRISPAVFGSLFQSVMEPAARRQVGAHYTSERDILKVVRVLFLDDLRAEFEAFRHDRRKLAVFHYNNFPWPDPDAPAGRERAADAEASCVREAASRIYWSAYHEGGEGDEDLLQPEAKPDRLTGGVKRRAAVEEAAQAVLDMRAKFPTATLADLYDPLLMPSDLVKAHAVLDRAVDRCYRATPFQSDRQRVEFLFARYEALAAPLLPKGMKMKRA